MDFGQETLLSSALETNPTPVNNSWKSVRFSHLSHGIKIDQYDGTSVDFGQEMIQNKINENTTHWTENLKECDRPARFPFCEFVVTRDL